MKFKKKKKWETALEEAMINEAPKFSALLDGT